MSGPRRPKAEVPRPYSFPEAKRQKLSNGLTLISAELRRLPVVTILAITDAGAESESPETSGLAELTANALAEGTTSLSGDELAQAFERLGGELGTGAGWTRIECGVTVMASRLEATLELLTQVVLEPAFGKTEVARLREERLAELLQIETEPRELADDEFARAVFGRGTRYAEPIGGNTESVKRLDEKALHSFYSKRFNPSSTKLIVVGDINQGALEKLVEHNWGRWSVSPSQKPEAPKAGPRGARNVLLVPRSDAPQTELRVGHASVARLHPDFYAITVMNAILGGLFNSRINLNLRERHAFTYGAFSSFEWRRHASLFECSTAVRSDVTAAALTEILNEIDRMRDADVGDAELSLARDYLTGVFPIRFESTAAIAEAIASRESFELDESYYDDYRARIAAVTKADVRRVAQEVLDPSRMQILAVGDPEMIRGPIEALKIAQVHVAEPAVPYSKVEVE